MSTHVAHAYLVEQLIDLPPDPVDLLTYDDGSALLLVLQGRRILAYDMSAGTNSSPGPNTPTYGGYSLSGDPLRDPLNPGTEPVTHGPPPASASYTSNGAWSKSRERQDSPDKSMLSTPNPSMALSPDPSMRSTPASSFPGIRTPDPGLSTPAPRASNLNEPVGSHTETEPARAVSRGGVRPVFSYIVPEGPQVWSMRVSLDRTQLALQRGSILIEVINMTKGASFVHGCYKGRSTIRDWFFADSPECNLALVTNQGLELNMYVPGKQGLRTGAKYKLPVKWHVYTHETRIVMLGTGTGGHKVHCYQFTSRETIKLPTFMLGNSSCNGTTSTGRTYGVSSSTSNTTGEVTAANVRLVVAYQGVYCAHLDTVQMQLCMYRLYTDTVIREHTYSLFSPRAEMSVVDSVLLVYHVDTAVVMLLDLGASGNGPIANPLPLAILPASHHQLNQYEHAVASDQVYPGPELYSADAQGRGTELKGKGKKLVNGTHGGSGWSNSSSHGAAKMDLTLPTGLHIRTKLASPSSPDRKAANASLSHPALAKTEGLTAEQDADELAAAEDHESSLQEDDDTFMAAEENYAEGTQSGTNGATAGAGVDPFEGHKVLGNRRQELITEQMLHGEEPLPPQSSVLFHTPPLSPVPSDTPTAISHGPLIRMPTLSAPGAPSRWRYYMPNIVLDQHTCTFYHVHLDLKAVADSASDWPALVSFLQRRKPSPIPYLSVHPKSLLLSLLRSALQDRMPLPPLRKTFDSLNRACAARRQAAARQPAPRSQSFTAGTPARQNGYAGTFSPTAHGPYRASTFTSRTTALSRGGYSIHTGAYTYNRGVLHASAPGAISSRSTQGPMERSNSNVSLGLGYLGGVGRDGNGLSGSGTSNTSTGPVVVTPEDMSQHVFSWLHVDEVVDAPYLQAALVEYAGSCYNMQLPVPLYLQVLSVEVLLQQSAWFQVLQQLVLQPHGGSWRLALALEEQLSDHDVHLVQHAISHVRKRCTWQDIQHEVGLQEVLVHIERLTAEGKVLQAARLARRARLRKPPALKLLQAAADADDLTAFTAIYRIFHGLVIGLFPTLDIARQQLWDRGAGSKQDGRL